MHPTSRRRILFLDAYDSFSNNITALLTTLLDVDVFVLHIDSPLLDPRAPGFQQAFRHELAHYDAVVCGPGPGSPDRDSDVGLMNHIWALDDAHLLPVLGVCLGFQSLVTNSGGKIRRLRKGLHGMVREIVHRGDDDDSIFAEVDAFKATLYHSLCVDVAQDAVPAEEWADARWASSAACPEVVPLAWVEEPRDDGIERILMAAKHVAKPFWGVQYHPESVCTEPEGNKVIANWFRESLRWNATRGRVAVPGGDIVAQQATKPSLLGQIAPESNETPSWWETLEVGNGFESQVVRLPSHVQTPDVLEALDSGRRERIVLDSANAAASAGARADVRGRFSIIALEVEEALRVEHHTGDQHATLKLKQFVGVPVSLSQNIALDRYGGLWGFLASFHQARRIDTEASDDTPFLGGFMGYVTYEQGLEGISVPLPDDRGHERPDVCLAWITRSVVIDHSKSVLYVQHTRRPAAPEETESWVSKTVTKLLASDVWQHAPSPAPSLLKKDQLSRPRRGSRSTAIRAPQTKEYEKKVELCQDFIAAGESYELCLTDQTTITRPASDLLATAEGDETSPPRKRRRSSVGTPGSWQLFKTLRARQPAPFASYIRLGGATLVSASPERFLRYDRDGLCSMRPMKGTVRKSEAVATLAEAEKILHIPKEEAENLMIVDLVRHDLHGICGAGHVSVPHLLKVEEYQSVFQMITVVEGRLPHAPPHHGGAAAAAPRAARTGWDVLAASLPPGSMTGAPKKRSCELLQQIEGRQERSLYSGVVGYMCASGSGDWSVTIRSMFRWDDEQGRPADGAGGDDEAHEVWHIGAGGAVTILSTPEGEREEMFTKLAGPLGVFGESG